MHTSAIDQDVQEKAHFFGLDPALIQAVRNAEGGALLKAVRCSVPTCKDEAQALEITCRTAVHRMRDYVEHQGLNADFVAFWSKQWAPVGAENDPKGLNVNWPTNVRQQWAKLGGVA